MSRRLYLFAVPGTIGVSCGSVALHQTQAAVPQMDYREPVTVVTIQ